MLGTLFERFVEKSPISVMVRGLMERIFNPKRLDELFEATAQVQYTRELLFSSLVDLMSLVVCRIQPAVNAAYKAKADELSVSRTSVYNKLNGVEPVVSTALLQATAADLAELIEQLGGQQPEVLPGYRTRILDGNCLAATDHRLAALRSLAAKALPGKSLVVLDPALRLAINLFPCEDGHAQERALFEAVLATVRAGELWIADRNMCTLGFLLGIHQRQADFIIREHKGLPWQALTDLKFLGQTQTGRLFEQRIQISDGQRTMQLRRVVLQLFKPTRHGETQIVILTSLPETVAPAAQVTQVYHERWSVETLFQSVTLNFEGEIPGLGYPKAALFAFTLALVVYNILATVRAALGTVHGVGKIQAGLSDYYLADEIQATYRGMMIAIEPIHWQVFESLSLEQLAEILQDLASRVKLKAFLKQPRAAKKKKTPLVGDIRHPHVSTHRILSQNKKPP